MNIGPTTLNRMSARQAADAVAKQMGPALEETRRIAETEAAENEKAAPAGTAENAAVNDNPAEHTAAEQRVIEEYKAAVPDSAAKKLHIVSAYMQKNGGSTTQELNMEQSSPQLTPETPLESVTSVTPTVAQNGNGVKGETERAAERTDDDRTHGLVMDQYWRRAYLPSKTSRALDALGEALGVEIRFAEQVTDSKGNAANAMYQDGVITISLDADTPVATAAIHEAVHAVRRFLLRQNKHLTQLQRDTFSDLAERTIAMESLLESAIREAGEQGVRMDGEAKFSIKRTSQMTLAEQLKMFYDGKMASSDAFYFGETPAALEKSGFDALPLAMTIGDFRKSTQTKHNIPRRVLKNLMNNLASPLFSFGSGDRAGIILDDIDGDGYKLLAALERGTNMDRKPVNVINSLYGLEHPAEWIKNQIDSGNEFVLYDEKRANAFLQTYGYSASVGDGIRSTGESVTQNGTEVKTKFPLKEDSEGRELTEAAEDLRKEPGTSEQEILKDYVKRCDPDDSETASPFGGLNRFCFCFLPDFFARFHSSLSAGFHSFFRRFAENPPLSLDESGGF